MIRDYNLQIPISYRTLFSAPLYHIKEFAPHDLKPKSPTSSPRSRSEAQLASQYCNSRCAIVQKAMSTRPKR